MCRETKGGPRSGQRVPALSAGSLSTRAVARGGLGSLCTSTAGFSTVRRGEEREPEVACGCGAVSSGRTLVRQLPAPGCAHTHTHHLVRGGHALLFPNRKDPRELERTKNLENKPLSEKGKRAGPCCFLGAPLEAKITVCLAAPDVTLRSAFPFRYHLQKPSF